MHMFIPKFQTTTTNCCSLKDPSRFIIIMIYHDAYFYCCDHDSYCFWYYYAHAPRLPKVTAESSTGFPPSPWFPESSAAKELLGLDDVLSCSVMFCLLSGCHRQPFGWALATLARFLFGILLGTWFCEFVTVCVSFGFCVLYSCQESTLPEETSTPSGMQWPGSALTRAEARSARSACVHALLRMHVVDFWCTLMIVDAYWC